MNPYGVPEISVEDLKALRERGTPHVLLDVREETEWNTAHIEGARLLPMSRLARELEGALPEDLGREEQIVVQCHTGVRSAQVAAWLRQQGFEHAVNLAGGIEAWSLRVDPGVPRY